MVSDITLNTDMWTAVRTLLVAASLQVTDGSSVKNATIAAAYNDENTSKPQVIIYPVERDENSWKFGSSEGKKFINITIEAYYKKSLGVEQLHDQIDYALKNNLIDGVDLVGITSDYAFNNPLETKYHTKTMVYSYDRE